MKCSVKNCSNWNKGKACKMSFFRFSSNAGLKKQWMSFCCRGEKFNEKTSYICMDHFKPGDFENSLQYGIQYRLRSYVIGHNEGVISDAANVETDDTPDLELTEKSLSGKIISSVKANFIIDEAHLQELTELSYDGLENLAGSICHKLKGTVPDIAVSETQHELATFSWVDHLSEGGLSKPNQKTMAHMQQLQKNFDDNNQEGLLITNNFLKMHMEEAINIECHHKIKKKLFFVTNVF